MWASEKVCLDAKAYFDAACEAIAVARESVLLEMYIFNLDVLGLRLLQVMRDAAARGVTVRVLVDGVGSPEITRQFAATLRQQHVRTRVYHPTPSVPDLWASPSLQRAGRVISNLNQRNHRKLIVVDQRTAFVGSCNVADDHQRWRETAVILSGAGVVELINSFELTWSRASYSGLSGAQKLAARLRARRRHIVSARRGRFNALRTNITRSLRIRHNAELVARIEKSVSRVWITTAYFVPSPVILAALLKAKRGGCDVKLLLPGKSDVTLVSSVSRVFYCSLMRAGVEIFEYQPAVLHAKTLIIDDWVCVGTTNLNHRSFYHDLELDVSLHSSEACDALTCQYLQDLSVSQRVTFDRLTNRSMLEKISGYLIYPFKRFI